MLTFSELGEMLDEITIKLPPDIFKGLNGGVNLLPDTKLHPESVSSGNALYILGEYRNERDLGRYINIYYGSFTALYGNEPVVRQRERIDEVLKHEFIHHLESMAGERDLEITDAIYIENYKKRL